MSDVYVSVDGVNVFGCSLDTSPKNIKTLQSIGSIASQLDKNMRQMGLFTAMAERYVDAELTMISDAGVCITHRFKSVLIDLYRGRPPRLIFEAAGQTTLKLIVSFTNEIQTSWLGSTSNTNEMQLRVLITVSGGVADYIADDGVDVEIFDRDDYSDLDSDEEEIQSGVPVHFADLAKMIDVPVQSELSRTTEESFKNYSPAI